MAIQERFFDFKSEIKSKKTAEHGAILNGIGPISGFDKISLDLVNKKMTLDTYNPKSMEDIKKYDYYGIEKGFNANYLIGENSTFKPIIGAVVTADGILTLLTEPLTIDLPYEFSQVFENTKTEDSVYCWCFPITAYHTYQTSSSPFATTFRIPTYLSGKSYSSGAFNYEAPTYLQRNNFRNWFTKFSQVNDTEIFSKLNGSNEVYIGLYTFYTHKGIVLNDVTEFPSFGLSANIRVVDFINTIVIPYQYKNEFFRYPKYQIQNKHSTYDRDDTRREPSFLYSTTVKAQSKIASRVNYGSGSTSEYSMIATNYVLGIDCKTHNSKGDSCTVKVHGRIVTEKSTRVLSTPAQNDSIQSWYLSDAKLNLHSMCAYIGITDEYMLAENIKYKIRGVIELVSNSGGYKAIIPIVENYFSYQHDQFSDSNQIVSGRGSSLNLTISGLPEDKTVTGDIVTPVGNATFWNNGTIRCTFDYWVEFDPRV